MDDAEGIATPLRTLKSMGFEEHTALAALRQSGGNLDRALEIMMSDSQPRASGDVVDGNLALILDMGFDLGSAQAALSACDGNVERAVETLMGARQNVPATAQSGRGASRTIWAAQDAAASRPQARAATMRMQSAATSQSRHGASRTNQDAAASRPQARAATMRMQSAEQNKKQPSAQMPQDYEQAVQQMVEELKANPFYNGWDDKALENMARSKLHAKQPQMLSNDLSNLEPPKTMKQLSELGKRIFVDATVGASPETQKLIRLRSEECAGAFRIASPNFEPKSKSADNSNSGPAVPRTDLARQRSEMLQSAVQKPAVSWKARDSAASMRPQARAALSRLEHQLGHKRTDSRSEVATCGSSDHIQEDMSCIWSPTPSELNSPMPKSNPGLRNTMTHSTLEAFDMYSALNPQTSAQAQVVNVLQRISTAASEGQISDSFKGELKSQLLNGVAPQTVQRSLESKINSSKKQEQASAFTAQRLAQDDEYEESLRQDRLKEEKRERDRQELERKKKEEEENRRKAEQQAEEYEEIMRGLGLKFAREPSTRHPDGKRVRFVMPSSHKIDRRFLGSDTIQDLHDFVELWSYENGQKLPEFEMVTTYPRIALNNFQQTLDEQGFGANTVLYIHDLTI